MVDAGIGRLLIASLHQGITDVTPTRLPFYEHWFTPPGIRDTKFGLAPLQAVLSFLRREGPSTYEQVMRRAGVYSAEWAFADQSAVSRAAIRRLPMRMRVRAVLYLCRQLVRRTFRPSQTRTKLRRGVATLQIRSSVFCTLRETAEWPTCVFYSAAVERMLQLFDVQAHAVVHECKGSGATACVLSVTIVGAPAAEASAEAA